MSSNRTASARAVVFNAGDVAAQRTAAFLKLLGIEREEITPETLIAQASSETGSPYKGGSPLVLSGEDIGLLAEIAARQGVSLDRVIAPFSTIILHSVHSRRTDSRAIEDALSGTRLSFVEFGSDSKNYSVCRNSSACGPLSGLTFGPIDRTIDCGLNVLSCDGHVEKLIEIDGAGLLTKIQRGPQSFLISTAGNVIDLDETTNNQIDFRTCFSRVVPLLLALRSAFGDACWQPQHYRANITIDDPPLWPRYGHLDLRKLAELTDRLGCACTIGMIPWNYRRSRRTIAELFARRAPKLGICYHGCNHTGAEFGIRHRARLTYLTVTARQRMDSHERNTSLPCQPVMIFPQGIFSVEAMHSLYATGYLAAVNTEIQDLQSQVPVTRAELIQPALLCYDNLPLFSRRNPTDGIVNFAVDAFLGKPCLPVVHHEFFKRGFAAFEELVDSISNLHPQLAWTNLENIALESSLIRRNSNAQSMVKIFSDRAIISRDNSATTVTIVKPIGQHGTIEGVDVDGAPSEYTWTTGAVRIPLVWRDRRLARISIRSAGTPTTAFSREPMAQRLRIAVRRYACEFRDNYLARSEILLSGAHGLRQAAGRPTFQTASARNQVDSGRTEN